MMHRSKIAFFSITIHYFPFISNSEYLFGLRVWHTAVLFTSYFMQTMYFLVFLNISHLICAIIKIIRAFLNSIK